MEPRGGAIGVRGRRSHGHTHRSRENMCEMRPTARILFLITLRRSALSRSAGATVAGASSALSLSSSSVHMLSTAANMSVTVGQDQ